MFSTHLRSACGFTALMVMALFNSPAVHAQSTTGAMPGKPPASTAGNGASGGSNQMHMSMMKGMDDMKSMPMTGDTDNDFASMMKMHHQQAVAMAKMELANGKSAEMKAMARKIIAAQQKEIAEFDKWMASHK